MGVCARGASSRSGLLLAVATKQVLARLAAERDLAKQDAALVLTIHELGLVHHSQLARVERGREEDQIAGQGRKDPDRGPDDDVLQVCGEGMSGFS